MNKDKFYVADYLSAKQRDRTDKINFLGMCSMVVFLLVAALLS